MRRLATAGRAATLGWHACRGAVRLAVRLLASRARGGVPSAGRVLGRTLAETLAALGPTYVKVGQALSTRADLLGDDAASQLARLVDRLEPAPREALPAALRSDGIDVATAFARLDRTPIASASIASVYRGVLRDGREVAVKVRRPGIARRVELDVRLLQRAAHVLGRAWPLRDVPVEAAVAELSRCVLCQLDFEREAAAARRLREALRWEPRVVVPALIDELCGRHVITMELVPGAEPGRAATAAPEGLEAALNALYRMIFVEGLVHCDLHAGNLRFLPGGRVAILDFGFVAEMTPSDRLRFAEFFFAMVSGDGPAAAEIALELAPVRPPRLDAAAFTREVTALVRQVSGRPAREFLVAEFAGAMFAIQRRHRVRGTTAFVMAIVSLLVFEGIVREVDPELDFQERAKPFILRASVRRAEPEAVGTG